jgi:hypothetical protein
MNSHMNLQYMQSLASCVVGVHVHAPLVLLMLQMLLLLVLLVVGV